MQETLVRYLGWKDRLEKGMATYSSVLAWEIPWIEEPGELWGSWGCKNVGHNLVTTQQQSPRSHECGTPREVLASIFKSCVSVECFQITESFPIQFYILDS